MALLLLKLFRSSLAFIHEGLHKNFCGVAPRRSVKIKIQFNFYFNTTFWESKGRKGLKLQLTQ